MKTAKITAEPINITEDFFIGNTYVQISDDYCKSKTSEDVDRILERIGEIILRSFYSNSK